MEEGFALCLSCNIHLLPSDLGDPGSWAFRLKLRLKSLPTHLLPQVTSLRA